MVPLTRDLTKELANKTKGTFVVAAVGDVLMQEPMGKMISPEIQRILREADITVGNKEHYVIDSRGWQDGHGNNWAPQRAGPGSCGPGLRSARAWRGRWRRARHEDRAGSGTTRSGFRSPARGPT